jgi:hypothetical protein
MTVFCKSEGMPFPDTFWFKVGYYWIKYPICEAHNHSASIASGHWHNVFVTPLIASADFKQHSWKAPTKQTKIKYIENM